MWRNVSALLFTDVTSCVSTAFFASLLIRLLINLTDILLCWVLRRLVLEEIGNKYILVSTYLMYLIVLLPYCNIKKYSYFLVSNYTLNIISPCISHERVILLIHRKHIPSEYLLVDAFESNYTEQSYCQIVIQKQNRHGKFDIMPKHEGSESYVQLSAWYQ